MDRNRATNGPRASLVEHASQPFYAEQADLIDRVRRAREGTRIEGSTADSPARPHASRPQSAISKLEPIRMSTTVGDRPARYPAICVVGAYSATYVVSMVIRANWLIVRRPAEEGDGLVVNGAKVGLVLSTEAIFRILSGLWEPMWVGWSRSGCELDY